MNNKLSKLFLTYSIALSLFILISGLLNSNDTGQLIISFLFLPIPAYLIYSFIKNKANKKGKSSLPIFSLKNSTFVVVFFAALFVFGSIRVIGNFKTKELVDEPYSDSPIIFPVKNNQTVVIKEDGDEVVNIRDEATSSGKIIQRAERGEEFVVEEADSDWYKIITEDGFGYISKDFVTLKVD